MFHLEVVNGLKLRNLELEAFLYDLALVKRKQPLILYGQLSLVNPERVDKPLDDLGHLEQSETGIW